MIDHVQVKVTDYENSKRFYIAALAPLGYTLIREYGDTMGGFGVGGKPDLWLRVAGDGGRAHVALAASDRKVVDAFHEAALINGGRNNGAPGLRTHYHPTYYGAFVLDPDGHNIEVVCHR
jgi:catechol 2,3-dioxygenase-like lactoylglutathione lyase family enzyme